MFFFLAMISRIFWILFMTFQLHFLWVPPHHLVLPDLPTNQLEKNSCYEIHFFTENLFGFTKPPFMAPFEHCLSVAHSTCLCNVYARQVTCFVTNWRQLATEGPRQVNTAAQRSAHSGACHPGALHQVVFLQVELQDRVFHSGEHEPYVLGVCGAGEVGIDNFLCVRV